MLAVEEVVASVVGRPGTPAGGTEVEETAAALVAVAVRAVLALWATLV